MTSDNIDDIIKPKQKLHVPIVSGLVEYTAQMTPWFISRLMQFSYSHMQRLREVLPLLLLSQLTQIPPVMVDWWDRRGRRTSVETPPIMVWRLRRVHRETWRLIGEPFEEATAAVLASLNMSQIEKFANQKDDVLFGYI